MKILTRKQIETAIDVPLLLAEMEKGLVAYSEKKTQLAPVSFLHFDAPPGDVHIKAGAIRGDDLYVVKIASGFYDNPKHGLPSSNGVMLLFSQVTGELQAILCDEGRLTDIRTGLAGAICAKYCAPKQVERIGIIGTGTQAREQLFHLQFVTACRDVLVWGRSQEKAFIFAKDPYLAGFNIRCANSIEELAQHCNLIVTATASTEPLLFGHQLMPGTHVTAVGADDVGKQELDSSVFTAADLIVVDSLEQCRNIGDLSHTKEKIGDKPVVELGAFIKDAQVREAPWITIADLTGIAVEDLQVAKAIWRHYEIQN